MPPESDGVLIRIQAAAAEAAAQAAKAKTITSAKKDPLAAGQKGAATSTGQPTNKQEAAEAMLARGEAADAVSKGVDSGSASSACASAARTIPTASR